MAAFFTLPAIILTLAKKSSAHPILQHRAPNYCFTDLQKGQNHTFRALSTSYFPNIMAEIHTAFSAILDSLANVGVTGQRDGDLGARLPRDHDRGRDVEEVQLVGHPSQLAEVGLGLGEGSE